MVQVLAAEVLHQAPIKLLAFSPTGLRLATADVDRTLRLWSRYAGGWRLEHTISLRHTSERYRAMDIIRTLLFDQSGEFIFVGSGDTLRAIRFSDGGTDWKNDALPDFSFLITTPLEAARGPAGLVSVCYADGTIESYRDTPVPVRRRDPEGPVSIGYLAGTRMLAGCDYYRLSLYDGDSLATLKSWTLEDKAYRMCANPVHRLIALRTLYDVILFDVDAGEIVAKQPARQGLPFLAWSLNGDELASMDAWGFQFYDEHLNPTHRVDTDARALAIAPNPRGGWMWTGSDGLAHPI